MSSGTMRRVGQHCVIHPAKVVPSLSMVSPNDVPPFHHEPLQNQRSHIRLLQVLFIDDKQAIEGS